MFFFCKHLFFSGVNNCLILAFVWFSLHLITPLQTLHAAINSLSVGSDLSANLSVPFFFVSLVGSLPHLVLLCSGLLVP